MSTCATSKSSGVTGASSFSHESAYVDDGAQVVAKIWHYSHVMEPSLRTAPSGKGVMVANNVKIGDGCKIRNNVSVYESDPRDYIRCGRAWCLQM